MFLILPDIGVGFVGFELPTQGRSGILAVFMGQKRSDMAKILLFRLTSFLDREMNWPQVHPFQVSLYSSAGESQDLNAFLANFE
jgi:hypothetical protein